jgi:hypothetical protein
MGKGSDRRPVDNRFCDSETFRNRWDQIFKKEEDDDEQREKNLQTNQGFDEVKRSLNKEPKKTNQDGKRVAPVKIRASEQTFNKRFL